ncbi:MAG: hypothetical protein LBR64_10730 [Dysgonamonadaceae bacterium]|jgi:hypothetical protein|nr:hypothetical protein [Dysgonamonadaceae bacterium]
MAKYIKVKLKDREPVVVLEANRSFYELKGAKITEPTKDEIEKFFPEEAPKSTVGAASANAELEKVTQAHAETAAELEKVKAELDAAQKQIEKLTKKA